jgi:hypothetical protein
MKRNCVYRYFLIEIGLLHKNQLKNSNFSGKTWGIINARDNLLLTNVAGRGFFEF